MAMAMLASRIRDRSVSVAFSKMPMVRMSTTATENFLVEKHTRRVFARYRFRKSKCAMSLSIIHPSFKHTETGDTLVAKAGAMSLEFSPAIGIREYDWSKNKQFALNANELGQILAMSPTESLSFYHDTFLGKAELEGTVRKSLKIEPASNMNGYFFSLCITNRTEKTEARFDIPILKGEFAVIRAAANYVIPYIMGWHSVAESVMGRS